MLSTTQDFRLAVTAVFWTGWRIATAFKIPGTNMNVPEFAVAVLVIVLVLRQAPKLLGLAPTIEPDQPVKEAHHIPKGPFM